MAIFFCHLSDWLHPTKHYVGSPFFCVNSRVCYSYPSVFLLSLSLFFVSFGLVFCSSFDSSSFYAFDSGLYYHLSFFLFLLSYLFLFSSLYFSLFPLLLILLYLWAWFLKSYLLLQCSLLWTFVRVQYKVRTLVLLKFALTSVLYSYRFIRVYPVSQWYIRTVSTRNSLCITCVSSRAPYSACYNYVHHMASVPSSVTFVRRKNLHVSGVHPIKKHPLVTSVRGGRSCTSPPCHAHEGMCCCVHQKPRVWQASGVGVSPAPEDQH